MWRLSVDKTFSAAHQLTKYNGPCENLHGHTWKIQIVVEGNKLDEAGMLMDFRVLKNQLQELTDKFDHKFLNDLFKESPTSEFLSKHVFQLLKKTLPTAVTLKEVSIWESESSKATYFE
ncbi:MAG: 6-carboxytetrahydropterin synthase QueD [Candidatus Margulisbacteria bacterium]|nr:6-carboxytetrahydropterin synthase QueD [Candidatus Margulisiibacteriota bacterium]